MKISSTSKTCVGKWHSLIENPVLADLAEQNLIPTSQPKAQEEKIARVIS
jgi:hypothetical protein